MGNSAPLPHIKEQHESSPFHQAPSDIGTQVRFSHLLLLSACMCPVRIDPRVVMLGLCD